MNIIYISSTCSQKKYTHYVESKGARVSQQAQKYNLLLAEGLTANGANVHLISSRPINRRVEKRLWLKAEKETVNGINFSYVAFVNYPVFRNISIFFGVFFRILFSKTGRGNTAVVCDALNIVATMAALAASFFRGYKTTGIVTDVPCHRPNHQKVPLHERLNLWVMKNFSSYLLLTQPMNNIVNPNNRPYIVLEGHSDIHMQDVENTLVGKADKKICFYAGSLRRIYGIENLVEGFVKANIPDTELHVYGNGDYVSDLKKLCEKHPNVKYMGIAPNETIVQEELKATLLVNPRPTNEDYTKYSFPSKNMEYMASGTPVLTTKLPGMPEEYYPYVFLLEDETAEGIKAALLQIFANDARVLHAFGVKAKGFILKEKNNYAQAKKVITFIRTAFKIGEL